MTQTPHDLAAVEQLLEERDAIHGWLSRLDAASASAPDSVRARVRRDYEVRMDGLTERLRVHADAVSGKLKDDRAEHAELAARATAAREALAEAELRHLVGEFEGERYDAERTRHSSDLETFELSLTAASERIARLEEVHALVAAAPKDAPPKEPVSAPVLTTPEVEPPPAAEPMAPEVVIQFDSEVEEIEIDDLAPDNNDDLLAVFEDVDSLPPMISPVSDFAPLSFRPSGNTPSEPARPVTPPLRSNTPPLGMPADVPPRFVRPGEVVAAPAQSEHASDSLFEQDIVAASPTIEQPVSVAGRTLRCGECGAMNRPLEWYCEKCGAELTAL
ncbi:MAG: hypothetical protein ABIZ70_02535 [Gemmatimonadales bacterium]